MISYTSSVNKDITYSNFLKIPDFLENEKGQLIKQAFDQKIKVHKLLQADSEALTEQFKGLGFKLAETLVDFFNCVYGDKFITPVKDKKFNGIKSSAGKTPIAIHCHVEDVLGCFYLADKKDVVTVDLSFYDATKLFLDHPITYSIVFSLKELETPLELSSSRIFDANNIIKSDFSRCSRIKEIIYELICKISGSLSLSIEKTEVSYATTEYLSSVFKSFLHILSDISTKYAKIENEKQKNHENYANFVKLNMEKLFYADEARQIFDEIIERKCSDESSFFSFELHGPNIVLKPIVVSTNSRGKQIVRIKYSDGDSASFGVEGEELVILKSHRNNLFSMKGLGQFNVALGMYDYIIDLR